MTTRNRRAGVRIGDIGRITDKVLRNNPSLEDQEKQLSELTQKIYLRGQKFITPRRGSILIRQIEDRTELNGIVIPDKKQSQALSEGIVLAVYNPWTEVTQKKNAQGGWDDLVKVHISQLQVGQRVLFNRWDGTPVPFLDEKKYRLIHEAEWQANGGILGIIDYKQDEEIKNALENLFKDLKPVHESLFRGKE